MTEDRQALLREVEALHAEVDAAAATLAEKHAARLKCGRGCSSCCIDELTVFEVEASRIRTHCTELLATAEPHAPGACAFLDDEGACRIYEHRPYVCRTQGLPLLWTEPDDRGAVVERRDICPLNVDEGEPLEAIAEADCWSIGPFESRLAELQRRADGGKCCQPESDKDEDWKSERV